jgi:hypothetical protein
MYDLFFISYGEVNAEKNWQNLATRFPHAKHVKNITGIHNAHKRCAILSCTKMFWTIDADTIVHDSFNFDFHVNDWDRKYLHVWYTNNPVNDLVYGYGAIKLWPKNILLEFDSSWLDLTTTVGSMKLIEEVVATTEFNVSQYDSWKSGFREAVKLSRDIATTKNPASIDRLLTWLTKSNDVLFAIFAVMGARAGLDYYTQCTSTDDLQLINDFDWLRNKFDSELMLADLPQLDRHMLLDTLKLQHV